MDKRFYQGNRERFYQQMKEQSLLVMFSGMEVRKTNDEYYPFYMDIYNKFPYDVMRWDVIRYMILYKIGGLYVDFDYECSLKKQGAILSNEEMAKIFGKGTYRCCCGTGSNVPCFNVTASSEKEALYYLPDVCSSYGGKGGCF